MKSLPDFPVEGGCLCGAVRYAVTAPPRAVYACHCKDCQRVASGPYGVGMIVERESFDVTAAEGAVHRFDKPADSGRVVPQFSCAVCGTRVWHEPIREPDLVIVRAGTLDHAEWAKPAAHIWTASKLPWIALDEATVNFERGVETREPLYDAWRAYLGG